MKIVIQLKMRGNKVYTINRSRDLIWESFGRFLERPDSLPRPRNRPEKVGPKNSLKS